MLYWAHQHYHVWFQVHYNDTVSKPYELTCAPSYYRFGEHSKPQRAIILSLWGTQQALAEINISHHHLNLIIKPLIMFLGILKTSLLKLVTIFSQFVLKTMFSSLPHLLFLLSYSHSFGFCGIVATIHTQTIYDFPFFIFESRLKPPFPFNHQASICVIVYSSFLFRRLLLSINLIFNGFINVVQVSVTSFSLISKAPGFCMLRKLLSLQLMLLFFSFSSFFELLDMVFCKSCISQSKVATQDLEPDPLINSIF